MINMPQLLNKIVYLASLRDIAALEQAFLKCLQEFSSATDIVLIRLNSKQEVISKTQCDGPEQHASVTAISVSKELHEAIKLVANSINGKHYVQLDQTHLYISFVNNNHFSKSYVVLTFNNEISEIESHFLKGIVSIVRNHIELIFDAQTDELTGLSNRKTFEKALQQIYDIKKSKTSSYPNEKRAAENNSDTGSTNWLVMMDIDYFKKVNDNFGHLYGDEVLILIARILKSSFRDTDLLYRFGGEEFALIVTDVPKDHCSKMLNRFRKEVAAYNFPRVGHITISLGACEIDPTMFHVTQLDQADQAMYHSKANGRNKVTFFDELLDSGLVTDTTVEAGDIQLF